MTGFLFDTNVLLDIATADETWLSWSEEQFRTAAKQGPILINPIIYAELAPASSHQPALTSGLIQRSLSDCRCPMPQDGWPHKLL